MTKRLTLIIGLTAATCLVGQAQMPQGYFTTIPLQPGPTDAALQGILSSPTPLPMWSYTVKAYDGNNYTGTIVGRTPYTRGKTTTTIPTQIIPLIITITDSLGTITYDPTANDPCITGSNAPYTVTGAVTASPIFTNTNWTMNGQNIGNTQYIDAFQRAEFWSQTVGTPYHLVLSASTLGAQSLSFTSSQATNYAGSTFGGCGNIGVVNINTLDAAVKNLITVTLAGTVNVGTFPIFLTKNVVTAETGHSIFTSCCVLGYHSAFTVGSNLQIYSPFSYDSSGVFGGDVSTLSHEMGEAVNDPTGNNPTPAWGNIGQVQGGCQSNFEVGDPLTPGNTPPSKSFTVAASNGLTYHLQEMAYYSWFFGGANQGTPGFFSNNGTLTGFAKACPSGGTN